MCRIYYTDEHTAVMTRAGTNTANNHHIIARATDQQDFDHEETSYTLTTRVEVSADRSNAQGRPSCKWVEARFSLKEEGNSRGTNVGHLYSYAVNRTLTNGKGRKKQFAWVKDTLTATDDDDDITELETVMQTLYDSSGNVKDEVNDYSDELSADHVLFIDTLQVSDKYSGTGLAQLAMGACHRLLPRLGNGHAFQGTIVLSPAASEKHKKDNGKSDIEIERGLIRSYQRSGYKVWIQGEESVEGSVTVVGRTL